MLFGFETNFECLFITGHVKLVTLECDVENGIVKYEMPCAASPGTSACGYTHDILYNSSST